MPVVAQQQATDTDFVNPGYVALTELYKTGMNGYRSLYNGIEYTGSYPGTTGHPYFNWDTLQLGAITYDGVYYPQVGLKFDLVSNEVVLLGRQNLSISLVPQKIDFFSIRSHLFIHLREDSSIQKTVDDGFYEIIYTGATMVLSSHAKKIERSSRVEEPFVFKQYDRYFVKKDTRYHSVKSEEALLLLFGNQKETLKAYLRRTKLNFKKDFANSLVKAVSYYDQLKN